MVFRSAFVRVLIFILVTALPGSAADDAKKLSVPYLRALREAIRGFNESDWPRAAAALDRVEKMAPATPMTLNMRGAIAIEQTQYEEGARLCGEALKLNPKFYAARFNLAEIELMKKNYPVAREMFQKFLDEQPKDELAKFRILLTYLLEKNDAEARTALAAITFPADTPAYYFANAAWEFAHGNSDEGKKWVGRSNWVFPPEVNRNFAISLFQNGWLSQEELKIPTALADTQPRAPKTTTQEPIQPFSAPKPDALPTPAPK